LYIFRYSFISITFVSREEKPVQILVRKWKGKKKEKERKKETQAQ